MMKDKLPDAGSEYEGPENGDVTDAIDFILQNMSEMNRLWVRLQHLSSQKEKDMREVERNELRVTVGENIIRLSSLDGLTFELYKSTVLPKILEMVVICKDTLAQQYLMECVIQAFPDEYHLQSLEQLLETTASLNANVDIKSIFINLMEAVSVKSEFRIDVDFNQKFEPRFLKPKGDHFQVSGSVYSSNLLQSKFYERN